MSSIKIVTIVAILIAPSIAEASIQVYKDGSSTITGAYYISSTPGVSDSFSVANACALTGAQVGLWVNPGDVPSATGWAVGTSPYGSDISSGTSTFTTVSHSTLPSGAWDVYQSTFPLSGALSPSTTYYLTLFGATAAQESWRIAWGICGGPSISYAYGFGPYQNYGEDFALYGSSQPVDPVVPEPTMLTTWVLLGLVAAVASLRRGRLWRRDA
jgi:hypothetical protein